MNKKDWCVWINEGVIDGKILWVKVAVFINRGLAKDFILSGWQGKLKEEDYKLLPVGKKPKEATD